MRNFSKYVRSLGCAWLIATIFILCIAPAIFAGWLLFGPVVKEYQLVRSLPKYPDSERVYDDIGYYGADTSEKLIYYWTPDSLTDVQEHYSHLQLTAMEDEYGTWQTAFISPEMQQSDSLTCSYQQRYSCATVSFISPENREWYQTATAAPCCFRLEEPPDADIPPYGTLIIFHFYIEGYYR